MRDYYNADLPPAVHHCLQELAADPGNLLMVMSGNERTRVESAFMGISRRLTQCMRSPMRMHPPMHPPRAHASSARMDPCIVCGAGISGLSVAAEHGFHYKLGSFPGVRKVGRDTWQQLIEDFDLSWKETTMAIMAAYTKRTNGATVSDKGSGLVWRYDDVDPEFASMQVKELHQHLQGVLANAPVEVTIGKGYLEVRPHGINKGVMLDHMLDRLQCNSGGVDFVLCIGDDTSDEYMFSALQERYGSTPQGHGPAVFTTVVGRKPSAAHYFLNDPDEVVELCRVLLCTCLLVLLTCLPTYLHAC